MENNFLGYSKLIVSSNEVEPVYFDRYPVLFSGLSHLILSPFWDDLSSYVYMARQWMNLIYIFSIFLIGRIIFKLEKDPLKRFQSLIFVSSSSLLLKYKDMIHFDQPAIVGCLLVLNGVVDYNFENKKKFLFWGALLGPLLGRGYAVIFFLASWFLVEFFYSRYIEKKWSFKSIKVPFLFILLSLPLPTISLVTNVLSEANIRHVSWDETSIVISAKHRLGWMQYKNIEGAKKVKWGSYILNQFQRTLDFLTPYAIHAIHQKDYKKPVRHYLSLIPKLVFQLFLIWLIFKFLKNYWSQKEERFRKTELFIAGSGVLWLVVMKNLAAFHEYVILYMIGFIIFISLFMVNLPLFKKEIFSKTLIGIYFLSLLMNFGINTSIGMNVNWQPKEFQKLREYLKNQKISKVMIKSYSNHEPPMLIKGVPYLEHFFLSGFAVTYSEGYQLLKVGLKDHQLIWE